MHMEATLQNTRSFGEEHFGAADLGDVRRTRRLINLADAIVHHPGGTLPQKVQDPAVLASLYRFCSSDAVTHASVLHPHIQRTFDRIADSLSDVLVIHDATELDYSKKKTVAALMGFIGDGNGRGHMVQHSLAVAADSREVLGLTSQILHKRVETPKHETAAEHRERESRESRLWMRGTEGLPGDRRIIDVCDSNADTFEFLEHEVNSGRRFVIRASHSRRIQPGHVPDSSQGTLLLNRHLESCPSLGTSEVKVQSKPGRTGKKSKRHPARKARMAQVEVSAASVMMISPRVKKGLHGNDPLAVWVVRVYEPNPPKGELPLEWILLTNEPVTTFEEATRVVNWYRCRWIIEEYHKAQKTGMKIESLQFRTLERLNPAIALLSVTALQLLRLREAMRRPDAETRPAREVVDLVYVQALSLWRHNQVRPDWSVRDFYMAVARMGGHQNRKGDGNPGWITLWRGWMELEARVDSFKDAKLAS